MTIIVITLAIRVTFCIHPFVKSLCQYQQLTGPDTDMSLTAYTVNFSN